MDNSVEKPEIKQNKKWALELIARHKAGEILTPIQIEKAYKAVGKSDMGES